MTISTLELLGVCEVLLALTLAVVLIRLHCSKRDLKAMERMREVGPEAVDLEMLRLSECSDELDPRWEYRP